MVVKMNKAHKAWEVDRAMNALTTYTASEARNRFADIFNEAHYGKPVLIDKHGRKVAVVSMSLLERLAELEACIDSMHAQQALEEFQREGGRTMEDIEKELGL
jgi:prevent-host-death family protein